MDETTTYADIVLGDRPGYLAVAYGHDGFWSGDRYRHRTWTEHRYRWPAGRRQLHQDVTQILAARERVDIYCCPVVRCTDDRRKGSALPPRVCWVDLDRPATDPDLLAVLDPFTVESGREGHHHVYVPLTRPVNLGIHARLNRVLAARLGGDAKWSDETLLRLPATLNHKTTPPVLVRPLPWSGRVWSVDELTALLAVDLAAPVAPRVQVVPAEPAPDPLPDRVRRALDHPNTTNRSAAHHRLVGACRDAGLNLGQTVTVVSSYRPSVQKYSDRLPEEVARSWTRIRPRIGAAA